MKKIVRVFPHKTKWTPIDDYAFIGLPPHKDLVPEHEAVHISCVFTWDKQLCKQLQYAWATITNKPVLLGGAAFGSPCNEFVPGMYIKTGVTFTSRGCNNNCPWCGVPKFEGKIRELPIVPGNIIQDNNFLQTSRKHKDKVFEMLKGQCGICFKGGLQPNLIDNHFLDHIHEMKRHIRELWIACDTDSAIPRTQKAVEQLTAAGFNQDKIYCYTLIGDDMGKNETRCRRVYEMGAMPFAQLRQPFEDSKIIYSKEWRDFACQWSRPAATIAHMKKGTKYSAKYKKQAPGQTEMEVLA